MAAASSATTAAATLESLPGRFPCRRAHRPAVISAKLRGEPNGFGTNPTPPSNSPPSSLRANAAAAVAPSSTFPKQVFSMQDVAGDVMVPLSALSKYYRHSPAGDWDELLVAMAPFFKDTQHRDTAQPESNVAIGSNGAFDSVIIPPVPLGMDVQPLELGRTVLDSRGIARQSFAIRSYEIGAEGTASMETLLKYLQEISLNHAAMAGLMADGFGRTPEMSRRGLIWAVAKMQVLVDKYPHWGDAVEVESWVAASGKNGMRRDWVVRDAETGKSVARATSVWVMMNKETRKLSKIPEEVRVEIEPQFVNDRACVNGEDEDGGRVPKLTAAAAQHACRGLAPRWADLDVNQHVNNVKYISWILESMPPAVFESHDLAKIVLEYRKECGRDSVLDSFTDVVRTSDDDGVECRHLLQLQDGSEILRCRTKWRPKTRADEQHMH